ncbi:MAG: cell envelope integrity protein TolA [bacterium]|nr:cell envelope integrity protein TolA [bacterium]
MSPLSQRVGLRQDSFVLAVVASLIAHLLFLSLWGEARQLHLPAIIQPRQAAAEAKEPEKRLEFELVETPSDAQNELPSAKTHLLSDKSTRARDLYTADDKPVAEAYSEGQSPYRTFSGGFLAGTGPELRPQPQSANESSRPAAAERTSEPGVAVAEEASERVRRERFSPEALAGHPGGSNPAGLFGSDDATYRQVTFSAEELGGVTLNTYAWEFAPYVLEMKRKIRQNIYPPPAFTRLGIISGETVLRFRVLPDGQMTNLEVLGYTGHPSLKETSVLAVRNAAPFKPLPEGFPEEYLELTWTFIYSVTRQ